MKKVVIILRDGFDADFICNGIAELKNIYEITIIYETGRVAVKKKIRRMLKNGNNILFTIINMCALVIYDRIMVSAMIKKCNAKKQLKVVPAYRIDDVNEEQCINICNVLQPDLVLIYGTGILKRNTIKRIGVDIYNIHSSILPYYRNVHSDFWAYTNKDYKNIGITVFKLDEGIDTGKIAKQVVCDILCDSKLYEYKVENLKNIVGIIPIFIKDYFNEKINLIEQDTREGFVSNTPKTKDIIRFLKTEMCSISVIKKYMFGM